MSNSSVCFFGDELPLYGLLRKGLKTLEKSRWVEVGKGEGRLKRLLVEVQYPSPGHPYWEFGCLLVLCLKVYVCMCAGMSSKSGKMRGCGCLEWNEGSLFFQLLMPISILQPAICCLSHLCLPPSLVPISKHFRLPPHVIIRNHRIPYLIGFYTFHSIGPFLCKHTNRIGFIFLMVDIKSSLPHSIATVNHVSCVMIFTRHVREALVLNLRIFFYHCV